MRARRRSRAQKNGKKSVHSPSQVFSLSSPPSLTRMASSLASASRLTVASVRNRCAYQRLSVYSLPRQASSGPTPPRAHNERRRELHNNHARQRQAIDQRGSSAGGAYQGRSTSGRSPVPRTLKPVTPNRDDVLRALRDTAHSLRRDNATHSIMAEWGLSGDCFSRLLASKEPEDERINGVAGRVIKGLVTQWNEESSVHLEPGSDVVSEFWDIENAEQAYYAEGPRALERLCVDSFLQWLEANLAKVPGSVNALAHLRLLRSVADMRFPSLQYPDARSITRDIHLHVGPTNSGKTHGALMALCKANTGIYAGPLRLLAHEVWDRINAGTVSPGLPARPCNLVTGEEVKMMGDLTGLTACTVEMVKLGGGLLDVAVIDEIQMIGDEQRGFAWTAAVLGISAKEMHLCGESSVVPLIERLAKACGDRVHVHHYERLTPLRVGEHLDGQLSRIQKGDCIVAFSRSEIFRLKDEIEKRTGLKCALAYGALPPETKSEQAKMFNDADSDTSVMVASDAIGMGLNLKIKRIVFSSVAKWNGSEMVAISTSQLKQIAGRAGRYGTTDEEGAGGLVTTLYSQDLPMVEEALQVPLVPITRAAIQPSSEALATIATMLPPERKPGWSRKAYEQSDLPRSLPRLFADFGLLSRIDSRIFFAGSLEQQMHIAPVVEQAVSSSARLTLFEREKFANSPANTRDERLMVLLANMVNVYSQGQLVTFDAVDEELGMLETLRKIENLRKHARASMATTGEHRAELLRKDLLGSEFSFEITDLMILETLHRGLTLYLWLSFRFPTAFCHTEQVGQYKERTEGAIDFCLVAIKALRIQRMAKPPHARSGDQAEKKSVSPGEHWQVKEEPWYAGKGKAEAGGGGNGWQSAEPRAGSKANSGGRKPYKNSNAGKKANQYRFEVHS